MDDIDLYTFLPSGTGKAVGVNYCFVWKLDKSEEVEIKSGYRCYYRSPVTQEMKDQTVLN